MLVKLSMEVVGRNILQVRGCPWGPGWCGVGRACSSPTCSRTCTAAPSACPPSTSGTCSSRRPGSASAPGTGCSRCPATSAWPPSHSSQRPPAPTHTRPTPPLAWAATDDVVRVLVSVYQDSKTDWLQISELRLITSLAISLPGKGERLPSWHRPP